MGQPQAPLQHGRACHVKYGRHPLCGGIFEVTAPQHRCPSQGVALSAWGTSPCPSRCTPSASATSSSAWGRRTSRSRIGARTCAIGLCRIGGAGGCSEGASQETPMLTKRTILPPFLREISSMPQRIMPSAIGAMTLQRGLFQAPPFASAAPLAPNARRSPPPGGGFLPMGLGRHAHWHSVSRLRCGQTCQRYHGRRRGRRRRGVTPCLPRRRRRCSSQARVGNRREAVGCAARSRRDRARERARHLE